MSDHLFGEIDIHKKLPELELFLCKPNLNTIGNLSESAGKNLNLKLSQINEIKFWIPYEIEVNHKLVKNPNIDKVKQRFVVRVQLGDYKENYMIKSINKVMDNDRDYKEITAYLLPYELADKNIRLMEEMTANIEVISNEVLSTSVWSIGHIDLELLNRFRKFEFSSITVLDAIFKIAETFEALIVWDTFRRKINFHHPDNLGENKGLLFDYGRYLESLNQDEQSDEMTTQLSIYGHDGLSINSINPSGTSYIEDYSYFLYPFKAIKKWSDVKSKKWSEL